MGAIFALITQSLTTIDDIFCELVFEQGGNTADDIALRGYLRDFARSELRRVLNFVVDDTDAPWTPYSRCPADADCNTLQSVVLTALVRFGDTAIIKEAFEIFYGLSDDDDAPSMDDIADDVFSAFIAGVLSYDTSRSATQSDVQALYIALGEENIEKRTFILNALGAVYQSDALVREAIEFVLSDVVRENLKVNALVAMKQCTARNPLWAYMTTEDTEGQTPFDALFAN